MLPLYIGRFILLSFGFLTFRLFSFLLFLLLNLNVPNCQLQDLGTELLLDLWHGRGREVVGGLEPQEVLVVLSVSKPRRLVFLLEHFEPWQVELASEVEFVRRGVSCVKAELVESLDRPL